MLATTQLPFITAEEMKSWETYGDPRYAAIVTPLFRAVMKHTGASLSDYGRPPFYFGDDDVDYITSDIDLIASVLHLYYEGTPAQLSDFLLNTEEDNTCIIRTLNELLVGGGSLYTEELTELLINYIRNIEENIDETS